MSVVSSFKITDWKDEAIQAEVSKPELVDYFTAIHNLNEFSKDMNFLKYFDRTVKLNAFSLKSKFNNNPISITGKNNEALTLKLIKDNPKTYGDVEIVTLPDVLSTIMSTSFEISGDKRKWKLKATFEKNKIFLTQIKDQKNVNRYERPLCPKCRELLVTYSTRLYCSTCGAIFPSSNTKNTEQSLLNQYELLKRYVFVRKPERLYRKVTSIWDKVFYEVYRLNIGDSNLLYASETCGVLSETKLNSVDELKTAKHIYLDISKIGDINQDLINYNPEWWARAHLINADKCIIGMYNEQSQELQDIINFNVAKFDDSAMYENLWSPRAAWNFLDDVLSLIKDEIYKINPENRSKYTWEFKSFENDKPFVTVTTTAVKNKDSVPADGTFYN